MTAMKGTKDVKNIKFVALAMAMAAPATAQAADAGETLYKQRCAVCHKTSADNAAGVGPNLRGVVGRQAAATKFNYSPALKKAKLTWNAKSLDPFLAAPGKVVPGTRMVVSVPDAKQRATLIAYLSKLK